MTSHKLGITEVVLRDAHQSLLATRMRIDDMLPIAEKLDAIGYWSMESWGGATFDSCIRYLGEDPHLVVVWEFMLVYDAKHINISLLSIPSKHISLSHTLGGKLSKWNGKLFWKHIFHIFVSSVP